MLVYKALYKKMMDDLKDAGMWLDWAEQIMCEYPKCANFLIESAEERLEKDFTETYKHFKELCEEEKSEMCIGEIVHDHIMEWHHALKIKAESIEEKMKNLDEEDKKHITKK